MPGTGALNQTGYARVRSVSCASAGNCSAGGFYWAGNFHPFVVRQVNGTWHPAIEVPGTGALNNDGDAEVRSMSCASAGNCNAAGFYHAGSANLQQAFVVSEVNGTWHPAIKVPGTGTLNKTGDAAVDSVSCASAGNCSADGSYQDGSDHNQAFVVSQT